MDSNFLNNILIFTDGACSGNPGPGGYGTVIVYPEGKIKELGGGEAETTNNRMEMMALIKGLRQIRNLQSDVWILTDSTYVIRGITQWIWGWKKRGWKTAAGGDVTNKDLWLELEKEIITRKEQGKVAWKYVRGHSGTPGNERCDEIAVCFSKKKYVELYDGELLNYSYAIHDLPDDMSIPEMKSGSKEKKKAHSYLSYVNGVLKRHSTWKECEAQVKGRSGAKFKKSTSASDEATIAKSWGVDISKIE